MRIFLHVTLFFFLTTLFSGCTRTNAFTRFHLSPIKERADGSLRSSKLNAGEENLGVVSTIYLNEIEPKKYNGMEYFFVVFFTKNQDKLSDPNLLEARSLKLKLNGEEPVKIKKLDKENELASLIPLKNDWNEYYLVAFNKSESEKLSLTLEDGKFGSLPLEYQKIER
jgi:hypothetical protein